MVWGMSIPSTFGDYWPEGDFESIDPPGKGGWRNRLDRYYQSQSPEVQKTLYDYAQGGDIASYPTYVTSKFTQELGVRPIHFPELAPLNSIKDHEPPQSYITAKSYKSLASVISLSGLLAVDERMKSIIERLEPGIHHFFPIEIRTLRGNLYPEQYHILVIGHYIDALSPEKSKEGSYRERVRNLYSYDDSKMGITGLALSKAVFGKAHLWGEQRAIYPLICLSDQLEAEAVSAGLRLPKHYRMMEV